jgi:phosphatidylserine/phosphatidylglycerophosphate/cardiolipin synthase-like enzyme
MIPIVGAKYPAIVIPLIDGAKKNIDIAVYDWRWYANEPEHAVQRFNAAIVRAVQRGVIVRAVLNTADIVPVLVSVGVKARRMNEHRTLHAKLIVIDDTLLITGSHNLTRNAFGSNIELSVAVYLPVGMSRISEFFNNLYNL